jgi:hypothetical protein
MINGGSRKAIVDTIPRMVLMLMAVFLGYGCFSSNSKVKVAEDYLLS